jgi:hypothetical protein
MPMLAETLMQRGPLSNTIQKSSTHRHSRISPINAKLLDDVNAKLLQSTFSETVAAQPDRRADHLDDVNAKLLQVVIRGSTNGLAGQLPRGIRVSTSHNANQNEEPLDKHTPSFRLRHR